LHRNQRGLQDLHTFLLVQTYSVLQICFMYEYGIVRVFIYSTFIINLYTKPMCGNSHIDIVYLVAQLFDRIHIDVEYSTIRLKQIHFLVNRYVNLT